MNEIEISYPEMFEEGGRIRMSQKGFPIGYALLTRKENIAILCDIFIYNDSPRRFRFFSWFKIRKNYRGLGYGSDLLVKTIEFCKRYGVDEIKGEAKGDLAILVPWYKKHGFTVIHNKIYLNLHRQHGGSADSGLLRAQ